jgi:hypothetical protein
MIAISGAGRASVTSEAPGDPTLTLDPPFVDFGETALGTESGAQLVTLTVGGDTVDGISISIEGPFVVADDDCGVLTDGEACSIEIRFVPTEAGSASGQLLVESGTAHTTAALAGTGRPPFVTIPVITGPPTTVPPPPTTFPPITGAPPTVPPPTVAPSTTGAAGTVPSTSAPVETREACDARALEARITYAPSLEMRVGEPERISASAFIGEGTPDTSPAGPSTVVVPQALQCRVGARLLGGEDFALDPEGWQEKSFLGVSEVAWVWAVTPRQVGDDLFLILEVQGLRFDEEAGVFEPAGEAFNKEARISVDSRPRSIFSQINDAASGVVTHPLVAFAGVGGLAIAFRWASQRRSKDAAERPDGPPPAN